MDFSSKDILIAYLIEFEKVEIKIEKPQKDDNLETLQRKVLKVSVKNLACRILNLIPMPGVLTTLEIFTSVE